MTFTGVPVSASIEPAWAPNTSGISSCDGERPRRTRDDDHHRQQRRDRAVDADERGQPGHQQHHQHEQPRPAVADPRDELLAGPGGDPGRVEPLADHEQRRDEDDRRVAEAGERLVEVQDAGEVQSASAAPIATSPTGIRFETNSDDDRDAGSRSVIAMSLMPARRSPARLGGAVSVRAGPGSPGPSGIPSRNHRTKSTIQTTAMITTYGSISAMIVPMPASFW